MIAQGQATIDFLLWWLVVTYGCAVLGCILALMRRKLAALAIALPALFLAVYTLVVGDIFRLPDALIAWIPVVLSLAAVLLALRPPKVPRAEDD
jgi:hypothetical protein